MRAVHPRDLAITDRTYELPADRIAGHPLPERDGSRLLVHRNGANEDRVFRELPDLLPPGSLLVLNDTRVVCARLRFHRASGAQLECMVLEPADRRPMEQALLDVGATRWWCMMGNAKRWKGEELALVRDGWKVAARRLEQVDGEHLIEFTWEGAAPFADVLAHFGSVPLPPYMRREVVAQDAQRYNTVFAAHDGSIAAPTASLHFTPRVLDALRAKEARTTALTLHVGAGTFLPVKSARMEGHPMHSEEVSVPREAITDILGHLGRAPIIAVGTTALRTLESLFWHGVRLVRGGTGTELRIGQWEPYDALTPLPAPREALQALLAELDRRGEERLTGRTQLLIAPGYRFQLADALVTNFHQPQSTLLLLVAAFIGPDWRRVYAHALAHDYRFLSYGDGSLLWRAGR